MTNSSGAYRTVAVSFEPLPEVESLFDMAFDTTYYREDRVLSGDEFVDFARGHDALIVTPKQRLDRALLHQLSDHLDTIGTYSVGTDHIDLVAARDLGFRVLNTSDVLTDAVAEVAMFLILGAARRATESIELIRAGRWRGWTPTQLPGRQLTGKRLGIFGMGRIGQAVAERARAFGLKVHYCNRRRLPPESEGLATFHASLEDLLPSSDILLIACPATQETAGLINATAIARLPVGAMVVNVARGNIVDDEALIQGLQSGKLWAAGLDVFMGEPQLDPRYFQLPNLLMTPHIGSSTLEAREQMALALVEGLRQLERGHTPENLLCGSVRVS